MNKFFDYIEITYDKLTNQMERWLKLEYEKSSKIFSHASPSGMIMHIQKMLFSNNILYLRNSIKQLDIETSENERFIKNSARISGHNPSRSISSAGTIKIKLKTGVNPLTKIKGGKIIFKNKTTLRNKTNKLYYTLTTGESVRGVYNVNSYSELYFNVKQGKFEEQTYTGDGEKNKSISVVVNREQVIDNFT